MSVYPEIEKQYKEFLISNTEDYYPGPNQFAINLLNSDKKLLKINDNVCENISYSIYSGEDNK